MPEPVDLSYERAVWLYVAAEKRHPTDLPHAPGRRSDIAVNTFGACPTCGPETTVEVTAHCACGATIELSEGPYNLDKVIKGVLAASTAT